MVDPTSLLRMLISTNQGGDSNNNLSPLINLMEVSLASMAYSTSSKRSNRDPKDSQVWIRGSKRQESIWFPAKWIQLSKISLKERSQSRSLMNHQRTYLSFNFTKMKRAWYWTQKRVRFWWIKAKTSHTNWCIRKCKINRLNCSNLNSNRVLKYRSKKGL